MNTRARLLIAEDSAIQATMLKRDLEAAGYQVQYCENGALALAAARENPPDLVLSDVMMPEMDGFTLCRSVRDDSQLTKVPVLLLTTMASPEDIMHGLAAGAAGYVLKPYERDDLLLRIHETLERGPRPDPNGLPSVDFHYAGQEFHIRSDLYGMLHLLVVTYENAIRQNRSLLESEQHLRVAQRDLSENMQRLATSETNFRSIVSLVPDVIYRIDSDGAFVFLNDAVRKLGYDPAQLIGKHFSSILADGEFERVSRDQVLRDFHGEVPPKLFDERRTGERQTLGLEVSLKLFPTGGSVPGMVTPTSFEVNSSGMYLKENESEVTRFLGTVGVIRDITQHKQYQEEIENLNRSLERRVEERTRELHTLNTQLERTMQQLLDAEEHLIQSEKMTAVGTMVGGVAHEINNPLMGALNYVQYSKDKVQDEKIQGLLSKAESAIGRATKVTGSMLRFIRREDADSLTTVDLHDSAEGVKALMEHQLSNAGVQLRIDLPDDLPKVTTARTSLDQILVNLIANASDAMAESDQKHIVLSAHADQEQVYVHVTDSGPGIPEEAQRQIFDAFFTTKAPGKGTGLGLAISQRLAQGFQGNLGLAESRPGQTRFTLTLPKESKSHG